MILFVVDGAVVGTTRSRNQKRIAQLARQWADRYIGRTVEIVYP